MKKINSTVLNFCICAAFLFLPLFIGPERGVIHFPHPGDAHDRIYIGVQLLLLAFFYFNYYVLIPKFYFRKKSVFYFGVLFLALIFFSWFPMFLYRSLDELTTATANHMLNPGDAGFSHDDMPPNHMHMFGPPPPMVYIMGVIVSLLLSINKRLQKTENEKVQAELSLLKAQINPHFLFNTLNNIYSLALTNDDRTADSVIQLSEIMRYIMENSHENIISLGQEISYLNNYISLQKSRLGNTVKISYRVNGNIIGKSVAPLILISFIENAFKHGVNPDENSEIDIQISVTESQLKLLVFNKKVSTVQTENGLGMRNTVERLELLYPHRHQLSVSETEDSYTVELMLQL